LFPSWGLRPGMIDQVVQSDLTITSDTNANTMISSGLDWPDQMQAIANAHVNGTAYTTWLDAPSYDSTPQHEAPVAYLASLAAKYSIPVAGENTGGGGQAALDTMIRYQRAYNLSGVMYMGGDMISSGSAGISLAALQSSIAAAETANRSNLAK
jgi:hypothetical protein